MSEKKILPPRLKELFPEINWTNSTNNEKSSNNTTSTSKPMFKLPRLRINPSDFEDPLPGTTSKMKTCSTRRTIFKQTQRRDTFVSSNRKTNIKKVKVIRKELFKENKPISNELFKFKVPASFNLPSKKNVVSAKKVQLDNTRPLQNVTEIEENLFQKSLANKNPVLSKSKLPVMRKLSQRSPAGCPKVEKRNSAQTGVARSLFDVSMTSTMFSDIERMCIEEERELNSKNLDEYLGKIRENLKEMDQKFTSFQQQYRVFQEEYKTLKGDLETNVKNAQSILDSKEGSIEKKSCSSIKKKAKPKNVILQDKSMEKSIALYNTLRDDYRTLLITPKIDKLSLETPKSMRKRQNESVSRKVQRQLLMLVDTPK